MRSAFIELLNLFRETRYIQAGKIFRFIRYRRRTMGSYMVTIETYLSNRYHQDGLSAWKITNTSNLTENDNGGTKF